MTEVNYLGQVYGVKAALPHLRAAGGGTIINVGSARRQPPPQARDATPWGRLAALGTTPFGR